MTEQVIFQFMNRLRGGRTRGRIVALL